MFIFFYIKPQFEQRKSSDTYFYSRNALKQESESTKDMVNDEFQGESTIESKIYNVTSKNDGVTWGMIDKFVI